MAMIRKTLDCAVVERSSGEAAEGADKRRTFSISSPTRDSYGDTIDPKGWDLEQYRRNPVVLYGHNRSGFPVGKSTRVWLDGDQLKAEVEFSSEEDGQKVARLVAEGVLKGASVGFDPIEYKARKNDAGEIEGIDFKRQRLVEWSIVALGANPDALVEEKSRQDLITRAAGKEEHVEEKNDTTQETLPAAKHEAKPEALPVAKKKKSMRKLVAREIAKAMAAMQADRKPATTHGDVVECESVRGSEAKDAPGMGFARFCRAVALGALERTSAVEAAKSLVAGDRRYGAVVKSMQSGLIGSGGALVPSQMAAEIIELLKPAAVVRSMNPMFVGMPTGSLDFGELTGGATASYVEETVGVNASEPTTGRVKLVAKKLITKVPLSNDLVRRAAVGVEQIIQEEMISRMAIREDLAFIRGDGASSTPRGFKTLMLAANVLTMTATPTATTALLDLYRLIGCLQDNNVPMTRCGWLMAGRTERWLKQLRDSVGGYLFKGEMDGGKLLGYPYKVTSQIPTNISSTHSELYFADFSQAIVADALAPQLFASREAAYKDSTGTLVSPLDRDETVLQVISEHDFALRHVEAAAMLGGVTWGA
jgi:HK97 family phage major capsid protein/HK97 family phage prohead protease